MKIVIWTKSIPKLWAIEEAIRLSPYFWCKVLELIPLSIDSEVSDMPKTLEESIKWAKNRALNSQKEVPEWDFFIWMEWATTYIEDKAYIYWVVYILDKNWEWHLGFSPFLEVPRVFEEWIYKEWKTLKQIHEEKFWNKDVWEKNGSFWMWSDNAIKRKEAFKSAFMCAISPFFNKYYN